MQKLTLNGPNFQWNFLTKIWVFMLTTIIFLFAILLQPNSKQLLLLKPESLLMEMDFWEKFSHTALQSQKNHINDVLMVPRRCQR